MKPVECWICNEERKKNGYGFGSRFGCMVVSDEEEPIPGPDLCDYHRRIVLKTGGEQEEWYSKV